MTRAQCFHREYPPEKLGYRRIGGASEAEGTQHGDMEPGVRIVVGIGIRVGSLPGAWCER